MSRIFWDTNLYIYLFEDNPSFASVVRALRERMIERNDELLTSSMTLAEIQVKALRAGNIRLAEQLRNLIRETSQIVAFDEEAADVFAKLGVDPAIKPQDAIQLSCAAAAGVELFITNDKKLEKLHIPGIQFVRALKP